MLSVVNVPTERENLREMFYAKLAALIATMLFATAFLCSCATMQSRYVLLGAPFASKPKDAEVLVLRNETLDREYIPVSRIDVHLEKTGLVVSSFDEALPELKKQARLSGADAIIDIKEQSSMLRETMIYHVSATGVRFTKTQYREGQLD